MCTGVDAHLHLDVPVCASAKSDRRVFEKLLPLVVEKESGRVISRETANKEVMTVYTEGGTAERPVPEALHRQPVLGDEAAAMPIRYGATTSIITVPRRTSSGRSRAASSSSCNPVR